MKLFTPAEQARIRAQFPILERTVRGGKQLIYLDSGATSQRPRSVVAAEVDFSERVNAAAHRGAHKLAEEATDAYEAARSTMARFTGAGEGELVWTKNATEALNTVAYGFINATAGRGGSAAERYRLGPGDEIVTTPAEHHANLIPWQEVAAHTGAKLRFLRLTPTGEIDLESLGEIGPKTRVVAFTHASNVSGAISPAAQIIERAREFGAITVLDACQSVPHLPVSFHELGVDFAAFSGHKMMGPTGVGMLYGRVKMLADLPPFMTGGSMVEVVELECTTFAAPPARFEAGTQMVSQTVGLAAAAQFLEELGLERVEAHERALTARLLEGMAQIEGLRILGPADPARRVGLVAFTLEGVHPHDVSQYLDMEGIAIRTGHHCAQPIHRHFGVHASARVSLGAFNTQSEIDAFLAAAAKIRPYFGFSDV